MKNELAVLNSTAALVSLETAEPDPVAINALPFCRAFDKSAEEVFDIAPGSEIRCLFSHIDTVERPRIGAESETVEIDRAVFLCLEKTGEIVTYESLSRVLVGMISDALRSGRISEYKEGSPPSALLIRYDGKKKAKTGNAPIFTVQILNLKGFSHEMH